LDVAGASEPTKSAACMTGRVKVKERISLAPMSAGAT
jgi:hypothetical protein